jgi:hypothetical protein
MKKVEKATGGLKKRIRNRMRSVNKKVMALAGRLKGPEGGEPRVERYRELVSVTRKIVHQAEGVLEEMQHLARHRQARRKRFREILETMTGRVRQVVRQTKARVFRGITQYAHKIVSLFEPHTEIIRKGKASKPNEFGNMVKVQEAENQIITHYEVFAERPEDSRLLVPAVEQHQRLFGRAPRMVAADAGFYSLKNEKSVPYPTHPFHPPPTKSPPNQPSFFFISRNVEFPRQTIRATQCSIQTKGRETWKRAGLAIPICKLLRSALAPGPSAAAAGISLGDTRRTSTPSPPSIARSNWA